MYVEDFIIAGKQNSKKWQAEEEKLKKKISEREVELPNTQEDDQQLNITPRDQPPQSDN